MKNYHYVKVFSGGVLIKSFKATDLHVSPATHVCSFIDSSTGKSTAVLHGTVIIQEAESENSTGN